MTKINPSRFLKTNEFRKTTEGSQKLHWKKKQKIRFRKVFDIDLFRLGPQYVLPPPPHYRARVITLCKIIRYNHYLKTLHLCLEVANNMHPLIWGGHKQKKTQIYIKVKLKVALKGLYDWKVYMTP